MLKRTNVNLSISTSFRFSFKGGWNSPFHFERKLARFTFTFFYFLMKWHASIHVCPYRDMIKWSKKYQMLTHLLEWCIPTTPRQKMRKEKPFNAFLKLFLLVLPIIYYNINCSKQRKQIAIFLFWIQADFIDEFVFISNIKFIDCWHLDFDIWLFWFCFVSFFFIDRCKLPVTHLLISLFLSKIWCAQQENKQHELCAFELMSYFWNEQNI